MPQPPAPPQATRRTPWWLRLGGRIAEHVPAARRVNLALLRYRDRRFPTGLLRLERALDDSTTVLEVGCGDRSPLLWFRSRPGHLVGVDLHRPSLEHSRALGIHDEYVELDALAVAEHFGPRSFDAVIALDLIEHLEPEDGQRLLAAMETVARHRVVVFTPNGWLEQGEYGGNPWQVHRSGWTPSEMRSRGYMVNGLSGIKWLRGEYAAPRWRPTWLWKAISAVTQPVAWRFPAAAYQILAVKEIAGRRPAEA